MPHHATETLDRHAKIARALGPCEIPLHSGYEGLARHFDRHLAPLAPHGRSRPGASP